MASISLDAPLTDSEGKPFDLMDTLPDPAASADLDAIDERDRRQQLHAALAAALDSLPPDERDAIRVKYFADDGHPERAALRRGLQSLRHPRISQELARLWH
jgi:DNA-directed RNA polymerase sigma subunit (sigma70/sigma32)